MGWMMSNKRMDWYSLTVVRCHGKPDGWSWCRLSADAPEDYISIHGAVPVGTKRNGSPRWEGKIDELWIRKSDVEETRRLWEAETGKCSECSGTGSLIESIHIDRESGKKHRTFRPCSHCSGSGYLDGVSRVEPGTQLSLW